MAEESERKKPVIFIIGGRNAGKTSLVSALTGYAERRPMLWDVTNKASQKIKALVMRSALQEESSEESGVKIKYKDPSEFPETLARLVNEDVEAIDMFILPLEIHVNRARQEHQQLHNFEEYLDAFIRNYDVKIAVIETLRDSKITRHINAVDTYIENNPSAQLLRLNLYTSDEHDEAHKIKEQFYP